MQINGLPVVDAKQKVKITISSRDVTKGKTKDPAACAAAVACLREVKNCTQARVHIGRTYLKIGKRWVRFHTPQSLRGEIVAFDRGANFEPGDYVLTPMQPSHRATGKAQGGNAKKKKGKKRPYHITVGVRHFGANR